MTILNSKGIIGEAEQDAASPSRRRGAFQNGLGDGDAGGNPVLVLAGDRPGRDSQEKLQLLRGQAGRGGRNSKIEIRNSWRRLRGIEFRVSISGFRVLRGARRTSRVEIQNLGRRVRTGECRISISDFRAFSCVSHLGQRQRVHPPPPSLALIRRELSWSSCKSVSGQ